MRENLVRGKGAHAHLTDEEVVHQAAEVGSNVVLRHRDEIAALIGHENRLLEELGCFRPRRNGIMRRDFIF